jgi:multiple sugar transport system ATP-binding protein
MNFFRAELRAEGESLYADTDTFKVKLPPEKRAAVAGHNGRPVIMGVRPEDIYERAEIETVDENVATLPVEVVEHLGSETYVYLLVGKTPAVARLDSRTTAEAGKSLEVAFDSNRIHLFDPESEQALTA